MAAKKKIDTSHLDLTAALALVADLEKQIERKDARIENLQKHKKASSLDDALILLTSQLCAEIDADESGFILGSPVDSDPDSGNARPHTRDMGLRIALGQITQSIHNQIHGYGNTKGAQHYMDLFRQSRDSNGYRDRVAAGNPTGDDIKLANQLRVQKARLVYLNMLKDSFQSVYTMVTREQWKPWTPNQSAAPVKKQTTKADLAAMLDA